MPAKTLDIGGRSFVLRPLPIATLRELYDLDRTAEPEHPIERCGLIVAAFARGEDPAFDTADLRMKIPDLVSAAQAILAMSGLRPAEEPAAGETAAEAEVPSTGA